MPDILNDPNEIKVRATQKTLLFEDEKIEIQQEVIYYNDQKFVSVFHNGQEMNMTVQNWVKLARLVSSVIPVEFKNI